MTKRKSYQLPEKDRERITRYEMHAVRWLIATKITIQHAEENIANRLECIPSGKRRFRLMLGQLCAICDDLLGTIPKEQRKQIDNVMHDMQLNMIPRLAPGSEKVIMEAKDLAFFIYHARRDEELCQTCVKDGEECRKCQMYQLLVAFAPLPDYGSGMMCPYNDDWMEK